MESPKLFPVLRDASDPMGTPATVPWSMLESPAVLERIKAYHDQDLDTLAARGGLALTEIAAHLTGKDPLLVRDRGDALRSVRVLVGRWHDALQGHPGRKLQL